MRQLARVLQAARSAGVVQAAVRSAATASTPRPAFDAAPAVRGAAVLPTWLSWSSLAAHLWQRVDAFLARRTPRLWKHVVSAMAGLTKEARFSAGELLLITVLLLRLQRMAGGGDRVPPELAALEAGAHHNPGALPSDGAGNLLLPPYGAAVVDAAELRRVRRLLRFAVAAYATSQAEWTAALRLPPSALCHGCWAADADSLLPAYYVAIDHAHREVIIAVRGTFSLSETLLNFTVTPQPFSGGFAHRGMHVCAEQLLRTLEARVKLHALLAAMPTYDVVLVGHSLGGAVAAMATLLLKVRHPGARAVIFSPPSCMSRQLALSCSPFVRSVIMGDDVVARFHLDAVVRLRHAMARVDVQQEVLRALWLDGLLTPSRIDAAFRAGALVSDALGRVWRAAEGGWALLTAPLRNWAPATAAVSAQVSARLSAAMTSVLGVRRRRVSLLDRVAEQDEARAAAALFRGSDGARGDADPNDEAATAASDAALGRGIARARGLAAGIAAAIVWAPRSRLRLQSLPDHQVAGDDVDSIGTSTAATREAVVDAESPMGRPASEMGAAAGVSDAADVAAGEEAYTRQLERMASDAGHVPADFAARDAYREQQATLVSQESGHGDGDADEWARARTLAESMAPTVSAVEAANQPRDGLPTSSLPGRVDDPDLEGGDGAAEAERATVYRPNDGRFEYGSGLQAWRQRAAAAGRVATGEAEGGVDTLHRVLSADTLAHVATGMWHRPPQRLQQQPRQPPSGSESTGGSSTESGATPWVYGTSQLGSLLSSTMAAVGSIGGTASSNAASQPTEFVVDADSLVDSPADPYGAPEGEEAAVAAAFTADDSGMTFTAAAATGSSGVGSATTIADFDAADLAGDRGSDTAAAPAPASLAGDRDEEAAVDVRVTMPAQPPTRQSSTAAAVVATATTPPADAAASAAAAVGILDSAASAYRYYPPGTVWYIALPHGYTRCVEQMSPFAAGGRRVSVGEGAAADDDDDSGDGGGGSGSARRLERRMLRESGLSSSLWRDTSSWLAGLLRHNAADDCLDEDDASASNLARAGLLRQRGLGSEGDAAGGATRSAGGGHMPQAAAAPESAAATDAGAHGSHSDVDSEAALGMVGLGFDTPSGGGTAAAAPPPGFRRRQVLAGYHGPVVLQLAATIDQRPLGDLGIAAVMGAGSGEDDGEDGDDERSAERATQAAGFGVDPQVAAGTSAMPTDDAASSLAMGSDAGNDPYAAETPWPEAITQAGAASERPEPSAVAGAATSVGGDAMRVQVVQAEAQPAPSTAAAAAVAAVMDASAAESPASVAATTAAGVAATTAAPSAAGAATVSVALDDKRMFGSIVLSRHMISDHLCTAMELELERWLHQVERRDTAARALVMQGRSGGGDGRSGGSVMPPLMQGRLHDADWDPARLGGASAWGVSEADEVDVDGLTQRDRDIGSWDQKRF